MRNLLFAEVNLLRHGLTLGRFARTHRDEHHREVLVRRRAVPVECAAGNEGAVADAEFLDRLPLKLNASATRLAKYELTGGVHMPCGVARTRLENAASHGVSGRVQGRRVAGEVRRRAEHTACGRRGSGRLGSRCGSLLRVSSADGQHYIKGHHSRYTRHVRSPWRLLYVCGAPLTSAKEDFLPRRGPATRVKIAIGAGAPPAVCCCRSCAARLQRRPLWSGRAPPQ